MSDREEIRRRSLEAVDVVLSDMAQRWVEYLRGVPVSPPRPMSRRERLYWRVRGWREDFAYRVAPWLREDGW